MVEKSVFEMILNKEIESEIIYEDDDIFSIQDINPVARIHLLIIPKKRINKTHQNIYSRNFRSKQK